MIFSGVVSLIFSSKDITNQFFSEDGFFLAWAKFTVIVLITTLIRILITNITKAESREILQKNSNWKP